MRKLYQSPIIVVMQVFCSHGAFAASEEFTCDCSKIVSKCIAAIMVKPTGPRKGAYGADLALRTTAEYCSKIDYFVDSTPYFTIIKKGYSGEDRVLGTSDTQFSQSRISDVSCQVCSKIVQGRRADTTQNERRDVEAKLAGYDGVWRGTVVNNYGYTLKPKITVNTVDGKTSIHSETKTAFLFTLTADAEGTIQNGTLKWTTHSSSDSDVHCEMLLIAENKAKYSCQQEGGSGSGELYRE